MNELALQKSLGNTATAPRWAVAHKFPGEIGTTRITNITVQVSRYGALTPVAELEPINIGGVLITRCTLHNFTQIQELDCRVGDTVELERAGDVIPKILRIIQRGDNTPYVLPNTCPSCESPLATPFNGELRCDAGLECPEQAIMSLVHFVSRDCFNIKHIGKSQLKMLYTSDVVKTPADLLSLSSDPIKLQKIAEMSGWGSKSVNNLIYEIEASIARVELKNLIYALGIKSIGLEAARSIANHYGTPQQFLQAIESISHCTIIKIGPKMLKEFHDYFNSSQKLQLAKDIIALTLKEQQVNSTAEEMKKVL